MDELTPEQQKCLDAAVIRAEEIRAQIVSALVRKIPRRQFTELTLDLSEEMEELGRKLKELGALSREPAVPAFDFAAARSEIASLCEQFVPTPTELALMELAELLAAKHGNAPPDFEAFYRWRSDLESRIATRESGSEDRG